MSRMASLRTSPSAPNGCVSRSISRRRARHREVELLIPHHSLPDGDAGTLPSICSASRALSDSSLLVRVHPDRQRRLEIPEAAIEEIALVFRALARERRGRRAGSSRRSRARCSSDRRRRRPCCGSVGRRHLARVARQDLHAVPFDHGTATDAAGARSRSATRRGSPADTTRSGLPPRNSTRTSATRSRCE